VSILGGDFTEESFVELLFLWSTFCGDLHAANLMSPSVELADGFAAWLGRNPVTDETGSIAALWWAKRDPGTFQPELGLLGSWMGFSAEDHSALFVRVGPNTAHGFANWLANKEPESRIRIEDMDLSVRAFNRLRSHDVRFVDQIDLDALDEPNGRRVRDEIAEKLRRWRGDDGAAGAPVPR
jgi:hypothetical protein